MAAAGEEDVEYESDPEEAKRSLAMRRREASDDEEGEGDGRDKRVDRPGIHSDDSDGQGGVAEYDDEEELDGEEEEEEEVDEDEEGEEGDEVEEEEAYKERGDERDVHGAGVDGSTAMVQEAYGDVRTSLEDTGEVHSGSRDDEEKKENEPFAVPTAGAFYMHDDRFRDNAGGRHRRTHGGRRLWESKDDRKWGHDKFEEMTLQERHYEEGRRSSKGNYRGRGKNRGVDRGYVQGNRKVYNNSSNQSQIPKGGVRGRGPRRYEPTFKRNGPVPRMQNKQSGRPSEKTSHASSGRTFTSTSNAESDPAPARKQVFASSLNSASPPFYPSSSSNKDINLAPKRDVQAGSTSRNVRPSVMDEGFTVQQTNALHRGKNVIGSLSMDKLYIDESISPGVGKPLNNMQMPLSGTSGVNASQSHPRAPAKSVTIPVQMSYQLTPSDNQVNKVSPVQLQATQKNSAPIRTQTSVQAPAPQLGQRPGSGSQASSPPKSSVARDSLDSGEMDASSESGKSKGALVGKGKGGAPGNGRGSFLYNNAQLMGAAGNMGGHGDQNFPAFLPVMQFGGQHPGGIGVPAVGMAFPGYVANPQLGLGNSEMTWLPVLAGAAGALGATYCSPYLAVDGAYHTRQSGQTSASGASSKENNTNKANNELKPSERPELVNNEFGQRQNKPRRYSEMNFGQ